MTAREKACPAIAALLAGLDIDVADVIATQAKDSADGLISQGWTAPATDYSLCAHHGDLQAAIDLLGRPFDKAEALALEACIRHHLAVAEEGDAS